MARENAKDEFAQRFDLLVRDCELQIKEIISQAVRRRPQGMTGRITPGLISAWRTGRNLPSKSNEKGFLLVVRIATEVARKRAAAGHKVEDLSDEVAWTELLRRARRAVVALPADGTYRKGAIPVSAPVSYSFTGKFEPLQDAYSDPRDLAGLLDLDRFTGREWLIGLIDEFIREHRRGHVFILAEAGIGKSTLAAHLVRERGWFHHFTRLDDGRSPVKARRNLGAQLIRRWGLLEEFAPGGMLPEAADEPRWFGRLLREAAARRDAEAAAVGARTVPPIVLVVDGLDEADPEPSGTGGLPLGLPARLPDGVFVIATSRFGNEDAMNTAENPEWAEIRVDGDDNLADMNRFLERILTPGGPAEDPDLARKLDQAGADRGGFRRALMRSCQGVWIYLYYVLEEIRHGKQSPAEVDRLPMGLGPYYADQVGRWRDSRGGESSLTRWERVRGPLLGVLAAARAPLTGTELAAFGRVESREAAREFVEETARAFLSRVGGENWETASYALRHQSLRDMLAGGASEHRGVQKTAGMTAPYIARAHENVISDLTPAGTAATRDWTGAVPYARANLAMHAAACGKLDSLACDPGFLLVTEPGALLARSTSVRTRDSRRAIEAFKLSLDEKGTLADAEGLSRLACNAARVHAASLAEACAERSGEEWPARWVTWPGQGHRRLTGDDGKPIEAVAVSRLGDQDVVIAKWRYGLVRIWDAVTGEFIREHTPASGGNYAVLGRIWGKDVVVYYPDRGSTILIRDALTGDLLGEQALPIDRIVKLAFSWFRDQAIIAAGGWNGEVLIWDADAREQICTLASNSGPVEELAIGPAGNKLIAVTVSRDHKSLLIWDALEGELLRNYTPDLPEGEGSEGAVSRFEIIQCKGRDAIAIGINGPGEEFFTILILVTSASDLAVETLVSQKGHLEEMAVGRAGDRDVIIAQCATERYRDPIYTILDKLSDWERFFARNLHIWDAATGLPVWIPLSIGGGEGQGAWAIAGGRTGRGRDIVVAGFGDGEVRIWEPAEDDRVSHGARVSAVAFGLVDGRDVVISYSDTDMTVRIWDVANGDLIGEPETFGFGFLSPAAIGRIGSRDVIVAMPESKDMSGGKKFLVREATIGHPAEEVLSFETDLIFGYEEEEENYRSDTHFRGNMESFALGRIGGRDVIATTSEDPGSGIVEIRIWDALTGRLTRELFAVEAQVGCPIAIGKVGDDDVIFVGGTGCIAIWNASTNRIERLPTSRSDGASITVDAVAVGRWGDRDVVVGSVGRVMLIWDISTGLLVSEFLSGHDDTVEAVAIGCVRGQDLIVTGSGDRTVMLRWNRSQRTNKPSLKNLSIKKPDT